MISGDFVTIAIFNVFKIINYCCRLVCTESCFVMLLEWGHQNSQPKAGVAVLKRLRIPALFKLFRCGDSARSKIGPLKKLSKEEASCSDDILSCPD